MYHNPQNIKWTLTLSNDYLLATSLPKKIYNNPPFFLPFVPYVHIMSKANWTNDTPKENQFARWVKQVNIFSWKCILEDT